MGDVGEIGADAGPGARDAGADPRILDAGAGETADLVGPAHLVTRARRPEVRAGQIRDQRVDGPLKLVDLAPHGARLIEEEVDVRELNARAELQRIPRRIGRVHVRDDEDEVAALTGVVERVGRIRPGADLDEVADPVLVGVTEGRVRARRELVGIRHAVVVTVGVPEVRRHVHVRVPRRGADVHVARFFGVEEAVAVRVLVLPVGGAVPVRVDGFAEAGALVAIEDEVVVGVRVAEVGEAVTVEVDGYGRVDELRDVIDAVVVVVGVAEVLDPVAVGVHHALDEVADAVAVRVVVDVVRDPVHVGVFGRGVGVRITRLDAVRNRVVVRIVVEIVRRAVPIGVPIGGARLVDVTDAIAILIGERGQHRVAAAVATAIGDRRRPVVSAADGDQRQRQEDGKWNCSTHH